MALTIETTRPPREVGPIRVSSPATSYHFEGEMRNGAPAMVFSDGLRLMGTCEASVEAVGPAPRVIGAPGFDFPDLDLHLTGSAYVRASQPEYACLDGSVVSVEGWVNLESGELVFEGRAL